MSFGIEVFPLRCYATGHSATEVTKFVLARLKEMQRIELYALTNDAARYVRNWPPGCTAPSHTHP
jgi:hypothetical protein